MSNVSIRVNDRAFSIGCEPGQEEYVKSLGEAFDSRVAELVKQVGQIGDLRLFLMAALVISDELASIKSGSDNKTATSDHDAKIRKINDTAVKALEDAAEQVEQIVKKLS